MEFRDLSKSVGDADKNTEGVRAIEMAFRIIPFEPDSDSTPTKNSNSTSIASTDDNNEEKDEDEDEEKKYKYKIYYTDDDHTDKNPDPFKYQLGLFYHKQSRETSTGIIVEPKFFRTKLLKNYELNDHFVFEIYPQIGNQDLSMFGGGHQISFVHTEIPEDILNNDLFAIKNFSVNENLKDNLRGNLSISNYEITGEGEFRKKDNKNNDDLNYELKGVEFHFNTLI